MDFSPYRRRYRSESEGSRWIRVLWALLIIFLGVGIFFALQYFFFPPTAEASLPKLYSENASRGEILPRDSAGWIYRDKPVDVWELDAVRSLLGAGVYLSYLDGSKVYLDQGAELLLKSSRKNTENGVDTLLILKKGGLWVEGEPSSTITVLLTERVQLETKGGTFMLSSEGVRVLQDGGVGATLSYLDGSGNVLFWKKISLGQEVLLSPQLLITAEQQKSFSVTPISPEFYETSLYLSRMKGESASVSPSPETSPTESPSPTNTDPSSLSVPTITSPGKAGETVAVKEIRQEITGTVPEGTEKVVVVHKESRDEYELSQFKAGEKTWKYIAHENTGNLIVGTNTYTVYAVDKDGKRSVGATIILTYKPAEGAVSGTLRITSPNNGNDTVVKTVPFDILGTAPSNAAYIEVNDYRLSKFSLGDKTWKYIATSTDEKTVYTVKALDKNGRFLASDKITVTLPKKGTPSPSPSSSPLESTSPSVSPSSSPDPTPTPLPIATPTPTVAPPLPSIGGPAVTPNE